MERSSTTPLDDDARLVLDELYWHTTTTMKAIAAQLGIPAPHVSRLARPLAAGIDCWWCHEPLTYASRSERVAHGPVVCRGCRASTPRFLIDLGLEPTDTIIVLTTSGHRSPADLSTEVADGARALAMIGLRWTGAFESIDVRRGPAIVGGAIGILPADIVVISSVRALGVSQGDVVRGLPTTVAADPGAGHHRPRCDLGIGTRVRVPISVRPVLARAGVGRHRLPRRRERRRAELGRRVPAARPRRRRLGLQ